MLHYLLHPASNKIKFILQVSEEAEAEVVAEVLEPAVEAIDSLKVVDSSSSSTTATTAVVYAR